MNHTIELPVDELKNALPGLNKVVGKSRSVLPSVRVTRNKGVTLQATGLDSCATYHTREPQTGPACELLVPFEPLKHLVKACPANERLQLTRDEKDRVKIRYFIGPNAIEKTYEAPFGDDWPAMPGITEPGVAVDDAFKQALREALDCVSGDDASRLVLQGACIEVSRRKARHLIGTDGRHLYCANSLTLDLKQSVIVPDRKFLLWPVFLDDGPWTLAVRPAEKQEAPWLQFASTRWTFLTKAIEGEYPDWRNVLPSDEPCTRVVLDEAGVARVLETVPRLPVSNEINQTVGLEVRQGKLWLKSRATDQAAWTQIEVPTGTVQGQPRFVRFNRTYLMKALRWGLNEIELRDPNTPLVFCHGGRKLVVAVIGDPQPPQAASSAASPPKTPAAATPQPSRQETAAAPSPSGAQSKTTTEPERNNMANTPSRTPPANGESDASPSALRAVLQQIETIKGSLRDLLAQVNDTANLLKAAEKEKRAAQREVESVRSTLRNLQRVQL